jgi:diguanylate cyclase (GGDEF)-like protein/PAS domain S-box-containing protein
MDKEIRILMLEDVATDAELAGLTLRQAGLVFAVKRVDTRESFTAAIRDFSPDLILADYSLPSFDGFSALAIARTECPQIPFIFLSGSIGEERAIEALKKGATDYVLKDRMTRLIPAVQRALKEARETKSRREAEEALLQSEERYALAMRGANDGLWDWDLATDQIYFSPRWKAMLGYGEHEIGSHPEEWFGRLHPEDQARVRSEIKRHLDGETPHFEQEHRIRHRDGTYRWVLSRGIAVRSLKGRVSRMAGSQTDITERKRVENQILRNAFYDLLTDLPNRALFMDRLGRSLNRSKRQKGYLCAVLFLGLDRFKMINDSLGHETGDELLKAAAKRLEGILRPGDTVARLGGDEFAILLDDINDVSDATRVASRIQDELGRPFNLNGHEVFTTASIGIVINTKGEERGEDLLREAGTAMVRAKSLGKSRYEMFDTAMHSLALGRLKLENDLRRAIERVEFLLEYQPIVSLKTGRITGCEALVRWRHPERGVLPPAEFIAVAEETALIIPMGEWVLTEACRQNRAWQDAGLAPIHVTVNLSALQFRQKNLAALITQALKQTALAPSFLKLELTESVVMENPEAARIVLGELAAIGVQLMIDDFGTGYSSLSYLKQFPFSALKIDRSFVRGVPQDPNDEAIVSAVVALAHSLDLEVIAEGVETEDQLSFLCSQKCDKMQGFLFSRPIPAADFTRLLADGRCLRLGSA